MKEKVLFIAAIIGTFSATIILLITQGLTILGVDTTGYVDIINMVGIGLAAIILIVGIIFLNKYSVLQQAHTVEQNSIVTTALGANAKLLNTMLPNLATQILDTAEERGRTVLRITEDRINTMMNEMLPALAEQTMQVVTEKSQYIIEQTTAKANATMKIMDELIPTYAKNISDSVAQTVRENNAHYHKMLVELKALVNSIPVANATQTAINTTPPTIVLDQAAIFAPIQQSIDAAINAAIAQILLAIKEPPATTITYAQAAPTEEAPTEEAPTEEAPTEEAPTEEAPTEDEPIVEETTEEAPTVEAPTEEAETTEEAEAQSDEESQKSDETSTV